jgi:outer membrane protein
MLWLALLGSALAMSPQEAIDAAVARAPMVDLSQARVAEAEAQVREARGRLLPTVALSGAVVAQTEIEVNLADKLPAGLPIDPNSVQPLVVMPQYQVQGGAQVIQPLVVPQAWAGQKAARQGESLAHAQAEADRAQVVSQTVDAWHASAEAHAVLDDAKRAEELAARLLEKGQKLADLGVVAKDDVLPFERADATAKANVAVAQEAVTTADGVLQYLTGLSGSADPIAVPQAIPDLQSELSAIDRPDLRAAAQRTETAGSFVALQRNALFPTLALVGGIAAVDPVPDFGKGFTWRVSVNATVPLFQGGVVGSRVDEASAQVAQARAAERLARQGAELQVRMAHGTLSRAVASLAEQDEAVRLARAAVTAAEARVDHGAGSLLQLQQAQLEQVAAEVGLTRARAQASRASDALKLAVHGTLQ